jgi:hypothetical protein
MSLSSILWHVKQSLFATRLRPLVYTGSGCEDFLDSSSLATVEFSDSAVDELF